MASNNYDSQASTNYKEAFALFDKRGNGRVTVDSLGDLLRACGQNPTLAEIQDLEKNAGSDCKFFSPFSALLGGGGARGEERSTDGLTLGGDPRSRLRDVPAHPQPPRRLPRPRRARGVLPRLPGLRQGYDGFHRRRPAQVHPDQPRREDDGRRGRRAAQGRRHELRPGQLHRYVMR